MNKLATLAVTALAALGVLGCGASDEPSATSSAFPAEKPAAEAPAPAEGENEIPARVPTIVRMRDRHGDPADGNHQRHVRPELDIVRASLAEAGDGLQLSITTAAPPKGEMIYVLNYFDGSGDEGGTLEVRTGGGDAPRAIASDADMSYSEQLDDAVSIEDATMTVLIPGDVVEPIEKWMVTVATRGVVPEISDDAPQQTDKGVGLTMAPFR